MAHEVNGFCKTFLYLPDIRKIQVDGEEYMGKDWRTITFRRDHTIQLKKYAYCVFICTRTNLIGKCQHAVCNECHEEHSKTQKRSRGGVPSERELMMSCHHEIRNLQLYTDIWWCKRKDWFDRVKGHCKPKTPLHFPYTRERTECKVGIQEI